MRVDAAAAMPRVFAGGAWKLAMGLKPLDLGSWLLVSEHHAAEVARKGQLLAAGADIAVALPEAAPAVRETLALVEAYLAEHHPSLLPGPDEPDPLRRCGLLVQEDFCWLAPAPEGYSLIAAFVAFPARWRLADKIGRPLDAIHAPVPGVNDRLGGPMARLFEGLTVERPVWRANWSILDDPELHQPEPKARHRPITTAGACDGCGLYLRCERQTLRRLPTTGVVVFTIHTFVQPLATVAADPQTARALADRLGEMPDGMLDYKNLRALGPSLRAYLRRRAEA